MKTLQRVSLWGWLVVLALVVMLLQAFGNARYTAGFQDGLDNLKYAESDRDYLERQAGP